MTEFAEAWRSTLEDDLSGFADRGIAPVVEREESTLNATWASRGKEHSELFGVNPEGALRWLSGPRGDDSYAAFLTSESMADFAQFASAIARTMPRETNFVPSEATVERGFDSGSEVRASPDALADLAEESRLGAEGRTTLLFLKGDPGAGKTTLLRETTAHQARRYLDGESQFLFFYVSAQGRELSNLRDAFSGELQDLRTAFTRDAIPALVRRGLLVPVVDAFDELLGTAGYSGAFSSLQALLVQLRGLGAVTVSARSSFYDIEFLDRSASPANQADISITTVDLHPWTEEQLREYLLIEGRPAVEQALEKLNDSDRQLLRRPFFASEFPRFAEATGTRSVSASLLEYLINAYIEREAEKIVDSNGDPVLPVDGHRYLFELAASQMWEAEARQLPAEDLRTWTELVAEEFGLGSDEAAQLNAKVTSYAGFRPGPGGGHDEFAFEHEVYFDYFLGRAVHRLLGESHVDELCDLLERGVLPEVVARDAVRALETGSPLPEVLTSCPTGIRHENRRRNVGALVAAYARDRGPLEGATLRGLSFTDVSLRSGRFSDVDFQNCEFFGVDAGGARFDECRAQTSSFHGLSLDNDSHVGIHGLRPGHNVGSVHHEATGDLYAPHEVREVLERLGAPQKEETEAPPTYSRQGEVLIQLLHRAARAYRRTNILYETDSQQLRQLFESQYWPELKRMLIEHGVVTEEVRQASGSRASALRLQVAVDQLLTGQAASTLPPGPIGGLWKELRAL